MDLEQAEENLQKFQEQISNEFSKDIQVFPISGKMGQNISPLLYFMREMYDKNKSDWKSKPKGVKLECHLSGDQQMDRLLPKA